ncbi:helix-turn-helix domain-containing protein [Hungatella effluvii]|nr:AraC family transcriptional regulator [Hungatella effluvii]
MPEKKDVIEEAKEYMNRNFTREISLNDISERFFINPYYFSQLFKKKTGETYQSYLTSLRISRAKKLLEETDLKIYEVCSMVGYSDTNHFNKVFERIAGIKPSEYKKNLRI